MEAFPSVAIADSLMLAAGVPRPWRATQYRMDEITKKIHLWITRQAQPQAEKKRNWFGMATAQPATQAMATGPEMQWRHLNVMNFTCQIHTTDPLDARHYELPWFGQPGLPFSNRLSHQVFACLAEGVEMSAVCAMLDIPFTDLWRFKYALDQGLVKFEYTPAKKTGATTTATPSTFVPSTLASNVPDVTDPIWERLITGEISVQIKTLSLQLMFTKLRQQFSLQQDDEVKLMKLRELHRYVERNERSLGYELHQFRELAQAQSA
ncbi:MAG: hypothetical protein Q8R67_17225 [Rhodoferax sp.]|nr:hypothetical protein [Rhodoferax sp.]MDP3653411.1 hypothetical protein [Rhodoferax sp.]